MRIAIYHPATLLGKELRERLGDVPELAAADVQLLSTREDEVGMLTDVAASAGLVVRVEETLPASDLAFFCGTIEETRALLPRLDEKTTAIVLSPGATVEDGTPVVSGVNLEQARAGNVLVSPHAGAVALARLLHPFGSAVRSVAATILLPVSGLEESALHELFEQTRSILAFAAPPPSPVLGGQLAFNVVQGRDVAAEIVDPLVALLGPGVEVSVQTLLGGVFHGVSVSAYVRLDSTPDAARLRETLAQVPDVELRAAAEARRGPVRESAAGTPAAGTPAARIGPIDAAQSERLLVGELRTDPRHPGAYWLCATLDNLTAGGALNALAIARAVV